MGDSFGECPRCGLQMRALFTTTYCERNCRRPREAPPGDIAKPEWVGIYGWKAPDCTCGKPCQWEKVIVYDPAHAEDTVSRFACPDDHVWYVGLPTL